MKMIYCVLIPMILAFSFLEGNGDETSYTSGSLNGFGLRAGLSLGIGF